MKEFIYYNDLFDIYEKLLTTKEQEAFKDYYHEDLSLSEIADNKNISRSAVQKMVKTVLEKLTTYEDILHIYTTKHKLAKLLDIKELEQLKKELEKIINN